MVSGNKSSFVSVPFQELKEEFLTQLKDLNYTYKSILSYRYPLNRLLTFLTAEKVNRIQDVTLTHLEKYGLLLVNAEFKPASIQMYVRVLKLFFQWLENSGVIFVNPASELGTIKTERRLQSVPSEEDMSKLLSMPDLTTPCGIRDRAIMEVAYGCALRLNELLCLTIFSIDLNDNILRVLGKGRKERILPLTSQAVFYLDKYLNGIRKELLSNNLDDNSLWISQYHRRPSQIAIQKMLSGYARKANIENNISVHAIRRACATHMLRNGAHPAQIQLLLGHASMRHLSQYLQLTITEIKAMHKNSKIGK